MPVQETSRTDLTKYVRLFVELHRLLASGAGDSEQADGLRDQLDHPRYKLSDVESRMTDILGADLYNFDDGQYGKVPDEQLLIDLHLFNIAGLEDAPEAKAAQKELAHRWSRLDEIQRERQRGILADLGSIGVNREAVATESKQAVHAFEAATKRREWDLALTILREHENEILPAEVAAMRGVCWAQLGNDEIAAVFFGEAVRQCPTSIEMLTCYLRSLIRGGHFDDARRRARFIVNKDADPFRLMLAADILFDCTMATGHEAARDEFQEIVNIVDRVTVDRTAVSHNSNLRQLVCSAYLGAAISSERLGNLRRAMDFYHTAHSLYDACSSPVARAGRTNQNWWGGSSAASIIQQERIALCTVSPIAFSLSSN